jgi:hypothetical protein
LADTSQQLGSLSGLLGMVGRRPHPTSLLPQGWCRVDCARVYYGA